LHIDAPDTLPDVFENRIEGFAPRLNATLAARNPPMRFGELTYDQATRTLKVTKAPLATSVGAAVAPPGTARIPIVEVVNATSEPVTLTVTATGTDGTTSDHEFPLAGAGRYFLGARIWFEDSGANIEIERRTTAPAGDTDWPDIVTAIGVGAARQPSGTEGTPARAEWSMVMGGADLDDPTGGDGWEDERVLVTTGSASPHEWSFGLAARNDAPAAPPDSSGTPTVPAFGRSVKLPDPLAGFGLAPSRAVLTFHYLVGDGRTTGPASVASGDDVSGGAATGDGPLGDLRYGSGHPFGLAWDPSLNISYSERDETGAQRADDEWLSPFQAELDAMDEWERVRQVGSKPGVLGGWRKYAYGAAVAALIGGAAAYYATRDGGGSGSDSSGAEVATQEAGGDFALDIVDASARPDGFTVGVGLSEPILDASVPFVTVVIRVESAEVDVITTYLRADGETSVETINVDTGNPFPLDTSVSTTADGTDLTLEGTWPPDWSWSPGDSSLSVTAEYQPEAGSENFSSTIDATWEVP